MFNRAFDVIFSIIVLLFCLPILLISILAIFLTDFSNPIYSAKRVGKANTDFVMYKLRTMKLGADKTGVMSTSSDDIRITKIGKTIRKLKLDEILQFVNVIIGDMSIVGPRPNTRRNGVDFYTTEEMRLLDVRPGITDFSSIVFSDEGEILRNSRNPDKDYNEIIRPWKSQLAILYIKHKSISLDIYLIIITVIALFSNPIARLYVSKLVYWLSDDKKLSDICKIQLRITRINDDEKT